MQTQWVQPSLDHFPSEGTAVLLLFEVTIRPCSLVQLELKATCQCLTGWRVTFLTATGEGIPQPRPIRHIGTFRDDYVTQAKPMSISAGTAGCRVGLRCFLSYGANRGKWNLTGRVALLLPVSREKHAVTEGSQADKR